MPLAALGLAVSAALVHAVWNLLLAGARDSWAATGAAMAVGCVLFAPVAVLTWDVEAAAWPYVVASAAFEIAYFALLSLAYTRGEMSAVYPLARGSAPVIVLLVSVAFLGVSLTVAAVLGVLAVAVGVVLVRGGVMGDVALALACGASIAAYTLIDNEGLAHASPLPYLEIVLVVPAIAHCAAIGRGRLGSSFDWKVVVAGAGMFASYALALAALELAAAAPVAAVRETSIVIGVALGALVLGEEVGRRRFAGALVIVCGVAAIALA